MVGISKLIQRLCQAYRAEFKRACTMIQVEHLSQNGLVGESLLQDAAIWIEDRGTY